LLVKIEYNDPGRPAASPLITDPSVIAIVVGLGGSAGSIEALETFFSNMPEDSGLAFVVVLHLSPEYESGLAGVLQKWTVMPIIQVSEPIKVEANCVYVIPRASTF
jgi:two-component system, chemotaxis family, CheB/CheR fusion protein